MADAKMIAQLKKQIGSSLASERWIRTRGTDSCDNHYSFQRGNVCVTACVKDGNYTFVLRVKVEGVGELGCDSWHNRLLKTIKTRWPIILNEDVQAAMESLKVDP